MMDRMVPVAAAMSDFLERTYWLNLSSSGQINELLLMGTLAVVRGRGCR